MIEVLCKERKDCQIFRSLNEFWGLNKDFTAVVACASPDPSTDLFLLRPQNLLDPWRSFLIQYEYCRYLSKIRVKYLFHLLWGHPPTLCKKRPCRDQEE